MADDMSTTTSKTSVVDQHVRHMVSTTMAYNESA